MSNKNSVKAVTLSTFDSSTLQVNTYLPINATGFSHSCFLIVITNASNTAVIISDDTDNDEGQGFIPANTTLQLNFQTNAMPNTSYANIAKGVVLFAKGTAGIGNVYLSGWYQPQAQL